jgi:uncharacterized membrane protein YfcA
MAAMHELLLVAAAGVIAGAMNALAGGGSFVTLPALIALGLPSVVANATSTVALLPGSLASAWVFRRDFTPFATASLKQMASVTLVGGLVGSLLLVMTPSTAFDDVLPWLLLVATVAIAAGPAISRWLAHHSLSVGASVLLACQLVLGVYIGYFGGAGGIMMMAVWSLLADTDLRRLHSARTLLACVGNSVAVVVFVVAGAVRWPQAIALGLGAVAGGFGGAHVARWLPTRALRFATVALCICVTVLFFARSIRS